MRFIDCTLDAHAPAILAILNEAIVNTTALYDYRPRTMENMIAWFAAKTAGNYPVIGVVDEAGTLLGFASYGQFRIQPAYKYTVEHSIYVHVNHRGQGLGAALLQRLITAATERQVHVLIGCIDAANTASIALHLKHGFELCGTIRQAGYKFDRWLDASFYQLILPTPDRPVDG